MPLPQWMQTGVQKWQDGGGVNGLMANPWFNIGQSIAQGQGASPGYVQSMQIQSMQQEQQRRQALQEAMKGLSSKPTGALAPQQPPKIEDMISSGIGQQAAGMGQYGTSAAPVPQINPSQPQPIQQGPTPQAGAASDPQALYRQQLEALAQYGEPAQQMAALKELAAMSEPAQGGFGGTSMEAQAANAYLNSLPPEQRHAAMLELSKQRLTRERTIATPQGTYTMPGYTLPGYPGSSDGSGPGGAPGAGPGGFTPKPVSESEARDQYVGNSLLNVSNMLADFNAANPDFDPTAFGHWAREAIAPGAGLENMVKEGPKQAYDAMRKEWASNLVFLRSGVTAREEEVEREMMNWDSPGDSKETRLWKARLRAEKELEAYDKGFREGRVHPEEYERNKALLQQRVEAARAALQSSDAKPWDMPWPN